MRVQVQVQVEEVEDCAMVEWRNNLEARSSASHSSPNPATACFPL